MLQNSMFFELVLPLSPIPLLAISLGCSFRFFSIRFFILFADGVLKVSAFKLSGATNKTGARRTLQT